MLFLGPGESIGTVTKLSPVSTNGNGGKGWQANR
jgi:hypothetical protein